MYVLVDYGSVRCGDVVPRMCGDVQTAGIPVPEELIELNVEMGKIPIPLFVRRVEFSRFRIDSDHALGPLPRIPGCGRGGALSFVQGDHRPGNYLRVPVDIDPILGTLGKIEVLGPSRLERSAWTLQFGTPYHLPHLPQFGGELLQ